jgi:5-methylcytosine-specific restriction endonuclease McrA
MVTLKEYFALRTNKKIGYPALTRQEAKILGISYPLQNGWAKRFGNMPIDEKKLFLLLGIARIHQETKTLKRGERKKQKDAKNLELCQKYGYVPQKKSRKVTATDWQIAGWKISKTKDTGVVKNQLRVSSDAFLQTFEWRKLRMEALKKYGPRCMCCGATPQTGAVMNVDHIKPRKIFPELALEIDNLQVLCNECNHGKGNWDMTDWREKEINNG